MFNVVPFVYSCFVYLGVKNVGMKDFAKLASKTADHKQKARVWILMLQF